MKKLFAAILSLVLVLSLSTAFAGEKLSVIATENPHAEILELVKDDLAALGYDLDLTIATDYVIENPATAAGDVMANFFQHLPYLAQYNGSVSEAEQLVPVIYTHFEPMAIYAGTKSSLDDIADGDKIAIPNDPVNENRALLLLQDAGLIKLPEGTTLESTCTPLDVVENTKNLGAEVCLVPGTYDDAHDKAVELQEETGMTFIHPYDDEQVIAGQGTIGLEILNQLPDVDAVVVPVGGGGLISGVAFAIKSLRPEVKVYGVQAEGAPSMYRSLHEHKYQTLKAVSTFADGIQVKTPGELTYQICEQYVDDIVTVSEDETAAAILSLMENQKLVAEGAGAVPVAAVLFHKLPVEGKKVACVVSGGNIDVNILNRVITRGLVMSGRKANMTIALEDKPGQLKKVAEIVSRCGSNVVSVQHDGSDPNMPISSCFLKLTLETRDAEQIEQIRAELAKEGFQLVSERV